MADEEIGDKEGRLAYLDLLASVLTKHEKKLDIIIKKLEVLDDLIKSCMLAKTAERPRFFSFIY